MHDRTFRNASVLAILIMPACYAPHDAVVDSGGEATDESSTGDSPPTSITMTVSASTSGDSTDAESGTTEGEASETGEPTCGNGRVEGDEACDDGINDGSYGGCNADCESFGPRCGDAVPQGDEACDDGDDINGNGCNIDCIESGTVLWTRTSEQDPWQTIGIDADDATLVASDSLLQYVDDAGKEGWSDMSDPPGFTSASINAIAFHETSEWMVGGAGGYPDHGLDAWWRPFSEAGSPGASQSFDNPAHSTDVLGGLAFGDDGQFYTCGNSTRIDLGQGNNLWLRKHDVDGDELWTQNYDGGDDDSCYAVAVGSDGYVVVGGSSSAPGEGTNAWLRKYGAEGNVEWTRSSASGGGSWDWVQDVAIAPDLSVVVIGNEGMDIWIRSYSSEGDVQWTSTFGNGGSCVAKGCISASFGRGIAIDSVGAVVAVGRDATTEYGNWVRKYDAAGNELWTDVSAPDPSFYEQSAYDVAITSEDAIVVVGAWDEGASAGNAQAWIQKYAP